MRVQREGRCWRVSPMTIAGLQAPLGSSISLEAPGPSHTPCHLTGTRLALLLLVSIIIMTQHLPGSERVEIIGQMSCRTIFKYTVL